MIYELGKEIYRLLSSGTTAAITTNIMPITGTANNIAAPYIVYKIISSSSSPTKDPVSKFEEVRLQVDVYTTTPALADALCYAVRTDLDKKSGSTYCNVSEISFISYGPQFFYEDIRLFSTSLDFNVIIIE